MLETNIDAWRISLLVSLGCAAACGSESAAVMRCDDAQPYAPGLMRCANGIVYRPAPEDCTGDCVPPEFDFPSDFVDRCTSGDDCAAGSLCIETFVPESDECSDPLESHFICQSQWDTCGAHQQCGASQRCVLEPGASGRHCQRILDCPVPGRPLLVDGEHRVASISNRSDWCGGLDRAPCELDAAARLAAAAHWQRAALLEHASIAAFARFTLQLLELGAPFELCQRSQRAMGDEAEHARLCFGLASRYSGTGLGPAPLPLHGALEHASLASVVELTFREGCVAETCAAVEAAEAHALASDALARDALARISHDERLHAELAFRFIAWALDMDERLELRQLLRRELAALREELADWPLQRCSDTEGLESERSAALEQHGVIGAERSLAVRRAAIAGIVLPCAERLIAAPHRVRREEGAVA